VGVLSVVMMAICEFRERAIPQGTGNRGLPRIIPESDSVRGSGSRPADCVAGPRVVDLRFEPVFAGVFAWTLGGAMRTSSAMGWIFDFPCALDSGISGAPTRRSRARGQRV